MIEGVIFDWGGVLMRTEDYTGRAAWDQRLGLPPGSVESVLHGSEAWRACQRGVISSADYWGQVAATLRIDPGLTADLCYDFYRGDRLDHSLITLVRALRSAGLRVALLSNNWLDLEAEMQALRVAHFFEPRCISAALGVMKPDPPAYYAALDGLGLPADRCVMVDDAPANVEAARRLGLQAIHYLAGMDLQRRLLPG